MSLLDDPLMEIDESRQQAEVPSAEKIRPQSGNKYRQHRRQGLEGMEQSRGGATPRDQNAPFYRNIYLIKNCDFRTMDGQRYMPTAGEIANIRKIPEQYKQGVEFLPNMSGDMVRKRIEGTFAFLENRRFSCAAGAKRDNNKSTSQEKLPRIWDGRTIRRKIKGNSALYILEDEMSPLDDSHLEIDESRQQVAVSSDESITQQRGNSYRRNEEQGLEILDEFLSSVDNATSSGISGSDDVLSEDESPNMVLGLNNAFDYHVDVNPQRSPLEGGAPCVFTFSSKLSLDVTSVFATFGNLGTFKLRKVDDDYLCYIPASKEPGLVVITLRSQDSRHILGQTEIYYCRTGQEEDPLKKLVFDPDEQKRVFGRFITPTSRGSSRDCGSGSSGDESQSTGTLGSSQPSHVLSFLIYTAAKYGAQQFIKMVLNSSAGRVVFNAYKDNPALPETIAKDNGNIETANYLEGITERFSEEIKAGQEFSQTVDWSELVKAAEEAQRELNQDTYKKDSYQLENDLVKETGYSADVEVSSGTSSDNESSDSEGYIPPTSNKGEVDNGNATQYGKDPPSDNDVDDLSSSFSSLGLKKPDIAGHDSVALRGEDKTWQKNALLKDSKLTDVSSPIDTSELENGGVKGEVEAKIREVYLETLDSGPSTVEDHIESLVQGKEKALMGDPCNINDDKTAGKAVDPSHVSAEIWKTEEKDQEIDFKSVIAVITLQGLAFPVVLSTKNNELSNLEEYQKQKQFSFCDTGDTMCNTTGVQQRSAMSENQEESEDCQQAPRESEEHSVQNSFEPVGVTTGGGNGHLEEGRRNSSGGHLQGTVKSSSYAPRKRNQRRRRYSARNPLKMLLLHEKQKHESDEKWKEMGNDSIKTKSTKAPKPVPVSNKKGIDDTKRVLLLYKPMSGHSSTVILQVKPPGCVAIASENVVNLSEHGNETSEKRILKWPEAFNNIFLVCISSDQANQIPREDFTNEEGKLRRKIFSMCFGEQIPSQWPECYRLGLEIPENKKRANDFEEECLDTFVAAIRGVK